MISHHRIDLKEQQEIKLCPNGATNLRVTVAKNGKVILAPHPAP